MLKYLLVNGPQRKRFMITLITETGHKMVALQEGYQLLYRKSDGLLRFSDPKGNRLGFGGDRVDDGITLTPNMSFAQVRELTEVIAKIAGLGAAKAIHNQRLEDFFVIEFV